MTSTTWIWILFNLFICFFLFLDLIVFHRKAKTVSIKEALIWSVIWTVLALAFNWGVLIYRGHDAAVKFLTGYLLERSLSMDNLFVFLLVFNYFRIPSALQHRILFWGILGALVMRGIFIACGITLIQKFHWIIYVFGAFLIYTGVKLAFEKDKEVHPEKNLLLRMFRKVMPVENSYESGKFFVKKGTRWFATPLFVVLIVIETTDVVFALDSIPAILGITMDPFIVYSSNVFAILGLRALYFALAGMMQLFYYLHYGLAAILVFVGVKMLVSNWIHVPTVIALGLILAVLLLSIVISLIRKPLKPEKE